MEKLSGNYEENVAWLDTTLGVGRSCDIVSRDYIICGRRARIWVVVNSKMFRSWLMMLRSFLDNS
jgi:hypothetical protein